MKDSSAAPTGVNSAMLASMSSHGSSHGSQGSMVSGNAGQEYNAFVDIGGDVGRDIINKSGLDSAMPFFVDGTDLKPLFDAAGQAMVGNINSGGLPKEMATMAPNDKVTQDNINLGSFNPIGNREGQKH